MPTKPELEADLKRLEKELETVTDERDDALLEVSKMADLLHDDEEARIIHRAESVTELLRRPFPPERVGLLPRAYGPREKRRKAQCQVCDKYHEQPAVHLDYVGHGAVTERLLEVDPQWNWEPLAYDDHGLPRVSTVPGGQAYLWIRLTVGGITRLGVGTVDAGKPDVLKELIGDALRNAAMRFGVALDLWIRADRADDPEEDPPSQTDSAVVAVKRWAADEFGVEIAKAAWDQLFPNGATPDLTDIEGVKTALDAIATELEAGDPGEGYS